MTETEESKIVSIGTAIPKNRYQQDDLANWMHHRLDAEDEKLARLFKVLYKKTKIETRHSVLSDFKRNNSAKELFTEEKTEPAIEKRLKIYDREAVNLAQEAVRDCLDDEALKGVTHLITVSCTGMSAPGIEIKLKQQLNLHNSVQTHAVNFIGCYAFFPALKMANSFCQADSLAKVLIVCIELCTIHFQNKRTDDHLLSNSLFSDGAAAALVTTQSQNVTPSLKLKTHQQLLLPEGENDMAWNIHSEGFLMKLSSYIPALVDRGIPLLLHQLFGDHPKEVNHWAIHPGGRKILEACAKELNLKTDALETSYKVLREYGNMSAPTILFVLKEMIQSRQLTPKEKLFALGFGPGLTMESALFEIE